MDYESVKKLNIKNPQTGEMEFKMYEIKHIKKLTDKGIDGKTSFVPLNSDNKDYQDILEWVAEGNTIEEAD